MDIEKMLGLTKQKTSFGAHPSPLLMISYIFCSTHTQAHDRRLFNYGFYAVKAPYYTNTKYRTTLHAKLSYIAYSLCQEMHENYEMIKNIPETPKLVADGV